MRAQAAGAAQDLPHPQRIWRSCATSDPCSMLQSWGVGGGGVEEAISSLPTSTFHFHFPLSRSALPRLPAYCLGLRTSRQGSEKCGKQVGGQEEPGCAECAYMHTKATCGTPSPVALRVPLHKAMGLGHKPNIWVHFQM